MTYQSGYLTNKEANIWFLRKTNSNQSEIARILNVSRQAVHKTLLRIDDKIKKALIDAAEGLDDIESAKAAENFPTELGE